MVIYQHLSVYWTVFQNNKFCFSYRRIERKRKTQIDIDGSRINTSSIRTYTDNQELKTRISQHDGDRKGNEYFFNAYIVFYEARKLLLNNDESARR